MSLAFDQVTAKQGNLPQCSYLTYWRDLRTVDAVAIAFADLDGKK